MPKFVKKLISITVVVGIALQIFPVTSAKANINSCSANVMPHSVNESETVDFSFQITNTDSEDITWIRIQTPSGSFSMQGSNVVGWDTSGDAGTLTLTSGNLPNGQALDVTVTVVINSQPGSSADWFVQVASDSSGNSAFTCTGNLGTEIVDPNGPPIISNIAVAITSNSAVISWTTSKLADGTVEYGLSSSYGSSQNNSNLTIDHLFTLENLLANTTYHFKVISVDQLDNSSQSGDNTFLTPALSQPVAIVSSGSNNPSFSQDSLKKVNLKATEKIPPTTAISTDFSKPFTSAPTIVGTAVDNVGVYAIEFSTDGGKNWLPADKQTGIGGKNVNFEFKPVSLDDGNYEIVTRATDTSGNIGLSEKKTLVIDRLPPIVGGSVISFGPQILKPGKDGMVTTVVGIDQKVTLAAVGGALQISIRSVEAFSKTNKEGQIFTLSRSSQTGLWSGTLSFSKEGLHNLTVDAIDGAGNKTNRDFGKIYTLSGGKVTEKGSDKKVVQARITLYYLEPDSNSWVVWDGSSYGQKNPQQTKNDGQFRLLAPAGKYYLEVSAPSYKTVISNIFEVSQTTPLNQNISLDKAVKIGFGWFSFTIPSLTIEKIEIQKNQPKVNLQKISSSLLNKNLPSFNLAKLSGGTTNHVQLAGKPTVISFVSTWSPASQEQFQTLEKLQKNVDLNIAPIAVLESATRLAAYKVISKLNLDFLVDPDGTTVNSFGYQSLPTHYFVNRKGIIKKIIVGVLSEKEILVNLGSL